MITSKKPNILHEELLKILKYDPASGIFTFLKSRGNRSAGSVAGSLHGTGYRNIEINNKTYSEHRLAWFYCFQEWPELELDHINNIKHDNRLDNLREATHSQNMFNKEVANNNKSGYTGVSLYHNGRWKASIGINGKPKHIGYYSTKEEAAEAYEKFKHANII